MLVKEVPNKWFTLHTDLSESNALRDDGLVNLMPKIGEFFTDFIVKLPRLVPIKPKLLSLHYAIDEAGMTGYHGRQTWFRPDLGNEGYNAKFYDRRYLLQLVAQIKAEARVLRDLVAPGGYIGTYIDHENFSGHEGGLYSPTRSEIEEWNWWKRRSIRYMVKWVADFMGQLDISYPNHGRGDYGEPLSGLSQLQWSDPATYRMRGGETHPHPSCQFWTTWGRPVDKGFPQWDLQHQPLTVPEILEMEVPDSTRDWGLFVASEHIIDVMEAFTDVA